MKGLKKQIILVIVLLLSCSSSWCQSSSSSITSTGGCEIDSIKLPIELIRLANIKLIQASADAQLKVQFKHMIETYKSENELLNNTIDRQKTLIAAAAKYNAKLQYDNEKLKKQRNILFGTNIGVIGILVLILL